MVPPRTYQKALRICADAGDRMTRIETDVDQEQSDEEPEDSHSEHDGDPRDDEEERGDGECSEDKVEEPEETQDNESAEQPGQGRTGPNNRSQRRKKTVRPPMDLALARYLTTLNCLVEVLDAEFSGPEHIPCIEVGGCYSCVARHTHREARAAQESQDAMDIHQDERPRNNPAKETYEETQDTQGATQSRRRKQVDRMVRQGKELALYLEALQNWRWQTFVHQSKDLDTPIQQIMTDTELKNIARTRGLQDISAFDAPETRWPARKSWRQEVLDLLMDIQTTEDDRNTEALATRTAKKSRASTSKPQCDMPRTPQTAKKNAASQVSKTEANDAKIQDDMIHEVGGGIGECILTWRTSPMAATPDTQGMTFDWQAQVTPVSTPSRPAFKRSQPLQSASPGAANTETIPLQQPLDIRSSLALMENHLSQYTRDVHNTQSSPHTTDTQTLPPDPPTPTPTSLHRRYSRFTKRAEPNG